MYKIEHKTSGYLLTFAGVITAEEMQQWVKESKQELTTAVPGFCVIVDMRSLAPLAPGVQEVMVTGQQLYKQRGMKRSAVVVNNAITASQFKHLAKQSGIYEWERYFDGTHPGCLEAAVAWGRNAVDPDA